MSRPLWLMRFCIPHIKPEMVNRIDAMIRSRR
jgi:hypothetical protein